MTKKEIINECIDMSYKTSKFTMEKLVNEATGERYMQTKMSVNLWKELHSKMQTSMDGTEGNIRLFLGSNVEAYRQ